jgi:pimeloyl-ACP methyl ester carboxylesterase
MRTRSRALGLAVWWVSVLTPGWARASPAEETFRIEGAPASLRLLLRHRAPASRGGGPTVLLVHGATFPSAVAAAYPLGGLSWMEDLAANGIDAWALDFAGFGGSDRYPEMARPAAGAPVGRAAEAALQIGQAIDEIRRRTGALRVSLVAHSWGTMPASRFAAAHPDQVDRLVLFGPIARRTASAPTPIPRHAYHDVSLDEQWESFGAGVPDGEPRPLSRSDFDAWGAAYLATDPTSAARKPMSVRVPYGPMADGLAAEAGTLPYDSGRIRVPTLIIRGQWDVISTDADARELLASLGSAPEKSYVVIPGGTHRMHLETSRLAFFAAVRSFLSGTRAAATDRR